jgi:hypothetical protein
MSRLVAGLRIIQWEDEMGNPRKVIVGVLLLATSATSARAQAWRNVEVGGSVGAMVSWWVPPIPGGDVRLTFPVSDRFAVETLVAATPTFADFTAGFYGVQVKQRIRKGASATVQPFVSYGAIGVFAHYHDDEYRYTSASSLPVVVPSHRGTFVSPPLLGLIGGGVQRSVASRLAVRIEAQAVMALVLPVGVRVAAGVSVPIGRLTPATRTGASR